MVGRIRVAVLGAGNFAREAHIPGLRAHPEAEVVALYSRSLSRAQQIAVAVGGVPLVTDDLAGLLARDDIDAVTVASSDDNHYHYTMAALQAGKHVYCEKPLAVRAELAAEMARAAQERQRIGYVGFIFRYTYCVQALRQRIRAGDIGRPYWVWLQWLGYGQRRTGAPSTWRDRAASYGAGWVAEIGSHFVDAINWIVGPVAGVCALVDALPQMAVEGERLIPRETFDHGSVLIRTGTGAQGELMVSRIVPGHEALPFIQVVGEEGALWASLTRGQQEFLRVCRPGGGWEAVELPPAAQDGKPHAIARMMGGFVDACLRGAIDREQDADFVEGYMVQSALDQAVASARTGQFEPVAQGLASPRV